MELILQKELPHQQKAIDALCGAMDGVALTPPRQFYENPQLGANDCLHYDIKMETGTGKTYVYTKTMFELHKRLGLNKFIIAVPTLPIKAGTAQFLMDEYVRRHFSDVCGYDAELVVGVLEAPKKQKKGRSYFPGTVSDFIKGSCQTPRKIYVLLLNMQLLTNAKLLTRDDYDYGAEGFYCPLDALKATRPVVIIDEPHRFSREQKAYKVIADELQPQSIIRFGATFPEVTVGRGKDKVTRKDYQNLLYDLNACDSFNQNLIKGVAKEHFDPVSKRAEKVKIADITAKESVTFHYKKKNEPSKSYLLSKDDSLAVISDAFEGITIQAIGETKVEFSNGIIKSKGEEMDVEIYMTSYQEQMLCLAIERHFETEKENFCGRNYKIKTLALFFIDDISSYRPNAEGKTPYLRETFERLLKEKLEAMLASLDARDTEYREYLQASLAGVSDCHAGYFAQDNDVNSQEVAQEVEAILHGKKQLLSFRKPDGSWHTLRFLFSKWTLKEGWDNPNVFTIAKLRSSGSENSKLQEVGRGLRLPVDENGNRIANEEFLLNYIVDFTEADFAERLVKQINGELPQANTITEAKLQQVAQKLGLSADALFDTLYDKHYINRHMNIMPETRDAFFAEYPDFAAGLGAGKVKDRNKQKPRPVKIRQAVYNEIRSLWETINQWYLLFYDAELDTNMDAAILSILEQGIFTDVVMSSTREEIRSANGQMKIETGSNVQYIVTRPIPYGVFLQRVSRGTNLPVAALHQAMRAYTQAHGTVDSEKINESSAAAFIQKFKEWKNNNLQGHFRYVNSNLPVGATALSFADGSVREEIAQGRIGTKIEQGDPIAKYLYDVYAYDSPLELKNMTANIEEVVVYGKIPRCSIAIPTTTGGTYSPDFMYVVQRTDGSKELNIVVETKDMDNRTQLRGDEYVKIECAKVFFSMLQADGYAVEFRDQFGNKAMKEIVNEVLAG